MENGVKIFKLENVIIPFRPLTFYMVNFEVFTSSSDLTASEIRGMNYQGFFPAV